MNTLPIIIVGGGLAGLAMANALAIRGLSSVVLEKTKSPGDIDRGDVLHRSTILLLKSWGVQERLQTYNPFQFSRFQIFDNNGKEIFTIDIDQSLDPTAKFLVLRHPMIESFLEETATSTGLTSIMRGVSCSDLIIRGERVVGVNTSIGIIESDLTIIANGAKSVLRDKYFKGRLFHDYFISFYNARYRSKRDFGNVGFYVIGEAGIMIFVALPNQEVRIGLQCGRRERVHPEHAENMIRARLKTFPVHDLEFVDAHLYPVTMSLSNHLHIPGAVLIGDAAHTVHPVGGQGGNLAFQDAEMLAQYIAENSTSIEALDNACKAYSINRHRQLKAILFRIHFFAQWSLLKNPLLINLRQKFLWLANKSDFIKKLIFRRIVDVR